MTTLLAIDQGTTSSRAILFSSTGDILETAQTELPQIYPHKGWVEQDATQIWQDVKNCCETLMRNAPEAAKNLAGIGITNQRETTVIWDRTTGKPVYNAIVWQDRRTADFCRSLADAGHEKTVTDKTGLLIDPYFSASKIRWLLDNVEGVRAKADKGDLAFGTIDCFLLWHLTGGKVHATDATNAARTSLYNIVTQQWDDELLAIFGIPASLLPDVKDNVASFGQTDLFGKSLTIGGMAGDQHAAMIGQACFQPGMIKSTYGTGCFALMHIGDQFEISQNRLITTPAYRLNGKMSYAIEGSIFMAGAVVQWLRDSLQIIASAPESEDLATSIADSNGVIFIPAFTGLGAPHWKPEAEAAIVGLTRDNGRAHIVRAALEAQAFQTMDLLQAMKKDTGRAPETMRADGGLVANKFVCQCLADLLDFNIEIPKVTETTALGAAFLAGLQAGVYDDLDDVAQHWHADKKYTPQPQGLLTSEDYKRWQTLIEKLY